MNTAEPATSDTKRPIELAPEGVVLDGKVVPLYAGSVHYWRLEPQSWRSCLAAIKHLGLRWVDVYVPWNVHEVAPGILELGQSDPQRDIGAFLRLAHELGLYAIVRPGPHINGELTYFGIPERVVWDPACQARTPRGHPVMLPMVPFAFPVPSYASEAFLDEATRYFQALAPTLVPLLYPNGPIVLLQVDNEGALYFRDGAYDQDYHPDAIRLYRAFLREKYQTMGALQEAYAGEPAAERRGATVPPPAPTAGSMPPPDDESKDLRFATINPPTRFDAKAPGQLVAHLDWSEFHEHLLASALERLSRALRDAGLRGVPTTHNLPMGQEATPLNVARMTRGVDFVGLDYYYTASERSRSIIARRTSELAVRCEARGVPTFACEMGAGFPPFFPPLDERDSAFTVLAALAYGLRGFNVYMAVERDRWIGAPIDRQGRSRPFAAFWQKLTAALERTDFARLRRRVPVRILTPRSERRLARVMHAFGPLSGAFFSVIGAGAKESGIEHDLGLGYPLAIESDSFVRSFESALEARGVPWAFIGGEDRDVSLEGARWIVCATSGGLHPELFRRLTEAAKSGARITIGPRPPLFDGSMRPHPTPLDLTELHPFAESDRAPSSRSVPGLSTSLLARDDPAAIDAAVGRAIDELELPTYACDPADVFATVHEDREGQPRVLFLVNSQERDVVAHVTVHPSISTALDVFDDTTFQARRGAFEIRLQPRTVRMLGLK